MATWKAKVLEWFDQRIIRADSLKGQFHKIIDGITAQAYNANFQGSFIISFYQINQHYYSICDLQKTRRCEISDLLHDPGKTRMNDFRRKKIKDLVIHLFLFFQKHLMNNIRK